MRILLLSMPDSFEHTPVLAIRMPNGALASLAGNVDPQHQVAIADLVLAQSSVRQTVERLVRDLRPELVGLSVMTFQRASARRIIAFIRSIDPAVRVVVGGYDPSLAPDAWMHPDIGVDFIVRGEADLTFRDLVRALEGGMPLSAVSGLWFRIGTTFQCTPARPVTAIEDGTIKPPNRAARVLSGYTMLGRDVDVVETSRGCTYDCSFCSIIEMRGRNFHRFPISRVIDDIRDARSRGARVDLLRRRQHYDRCPAVRSPVPRDRRGWPRRRRLHRAGNDGANRGAWRDTRPADAPGRVPLRIPRHREHSRRGPRVPEGTGEEQPARRGASQAKCHARRDRGPPPERHAGGWRVDRRQPGRHAGVDRREPVIRPRTCRLALHSASDAVSGHADDARLPRTGSHRELAASTSTTARRP